MQSLSAFCSCRITFYGEVEVVTCLLWQIKWWWWWWWRHTEEKPHRYRICILKKYYSDFFLSWDYDYNVFNYLQYVDVLHYYRYYQLRAVSWSLTRCYRIQSEEVSLDLPSSALSHEFTNLRVNSQYSFRVRASTAVGAGEPTRVVVASTVRQGSSSSSSKPHKVTTTRSRVKKPLYIDQIMGHFPRRLTSIIAGN